MNSLKSEAHAVEMYLSSRNVFAMQLPVAYSLGSQVATCGKDGPKDLHIVE